MKNFIKLMKHTVKLGVIKYTDLRRFNLFICIKESYNVMHLSVTSFKTTLLILSRLFKTLKIKRNDSVLFISDSEQFDIITKSIAVKCKTAYLLSGQYKRGFFSNKLQVIGLAGDYKPLDLPFLIIYLGCSSKPSSPLISELKRTDIILVGLTVPEDMYFQCDYNLGVSNLRQQSLKLLIKFYFASIYEFGKHIKSVKYKV